MSNVSIIIPTYNYGTFIGRALKSIHENGYPIDKVEIIIIDDGSTDNTRVIAVELAHQFMFQYHFQENAGKAAATRKGFEMASGDILFTLDADDWFLPGKIEKTVKIFQDLPEVMHIASPAQIVYSETGKQETEPVPEWLLGKALNGQGVLKKFMEKRILFGGGSTFAVRASVVKQMQLPDAVDMYTDEWLVIQALLKGQTYFFEKPLSVWLVHGGNYSIGKSPDEGQVAKQQRLERSSAATLNLITAGEYPSWLQSAYRLKHLVRQMVWKETNGTKFLKDRLYFFKACFLSFRFSPSLLWNYRIVNRLFK
jgi:glycosyltransferase involved in cell wall biosynthesis